MAKNDNKTSYTSVRPDYKNPPEGKIYFPRVLEDDPGTNKEETRVQFAAYGNRIVFWKFSATYLPCVMELIDDTPDNRMAKKEFVKEVSTLCKQRERLGKYTDEVEAEPSVKQDKKVYRELARALSLDKFNEETGEREIDQATDDVTATTVMVNETVDEMKSEAQTCGEDHYAIFKRQMVGFKQREIAAQTGIPTSTVSDHVKDIKASKAKHEKEVTR